MVSSADEPANIIANGLVDEAEADVSRVPDTLLLKPEDAAKLLGVGRQYLYDLITPASFGSSGCAASCLCPAEPSKNG